MDDDKERVESVAPVAKGMVASGREDRVSIVGECYGERVISDAATGMRRRRSPSQAKSSSTAVVANLSSSEGAISG